MFPRHTISSRHSALKTGLASVVMSAFLTLSATSCGGPEEEQMLSSSIQQEVDTDAPVLHQKVKQLINSLDLRSDQKSKVDALLKDTKIKLQPIQQAHVAILQELSAEIRAGRIDRNQMQTKWGAFVKVLEEKKPVIVAALNNLHNTLDSAQRAKLVEEMGERHPRWHMRGSRRGPHQLMRSLAKKIGITSEQASQLRELAKQNFKEGYPQMKARFKGMHQGRRAALEAFKSDTFEAGSLNIINITKMTDAFQRHPLLNWIEKAITLLTPEQRTKLADLLQQRAQRIVQ